MIFVLLNFNFIFNVNYISFILYLLFNSKYSVDISCESVSFVKLGIFLFLIIKLTKEDRQLNQLVQPKRHRILNRRDFMQATGLGAGSLMLSQKPVFGRQVSVDALVQWSKLC